MLNTNANFAWTRTELVDPNELNFISNKESDLVSIDNFEIGYRWQPTNRILLDAEAYMSKSRNYGSLMAESAYISIPGSVFQSLMGDAIGVD